MTSVYKYYKVPVYDVAICFEMENSNNNILFFDGSLFLECAKADGLSYCSRISSKSNVIFLRDYPDINFDSVSKHLEYDFFLAEFGFSATSSHQIVLQAFESRFPELFEGH